MNLDPNVQAAIWGVVGALITGLAKPTIHYFSGKAEREARDKEREENNRQQELRDLRTLLDESKASCGEKIEQLEKNYKDQMDNIERRSSEVNERLRQQNTELQVKVAQLETRLEVTEKMEKANRVKK